jgi:hypothetical protein
METKTFEVEGIGKFEFMPELPHTVFFMDRRKRLAMVLGSRREVIVLEAMINKGLKVNPKTQQYEADETADEFTQDCGWRALFDYNQAAAKVTMEDHITKFPEGKTLERLTGEEYAKVETEFNKQLDSFRNPKPAETEPVTPSSESQG